MAASNPHFDAVSNDYDRGRVSEDILFWAKEAKKISGVCPGSLVVDMGCGTGNYGLGIRAQTGSVVVGFDPSEGMLRQAHEKTPDFPPGETSFLCLERIFGKFQRAFEVRGSVNLGEVSARMANGILVITIPKLAERRGRERRIPVTG